MASRRPYRDQKVILTRLYMCRAVPPDAERHPDTSEKWEICGYYGRIFSSQDKFRGLKDRLEQRDRVEQSGMEEDDRLDVYARDASDLRSMSGDSTQTTQGWSDLSQTTGQLVVDSFEVPDKDWTQFSDKFFEQTLESE